MGKLISLGCCVFCWYQLVAMSVLCFCRLVGKLLVTEQNLHQNDLNQLHLLKPLNQVRAVLELEPNLP